MKQFNLLLPGKSKIMFVILHCFGVFTKVEVGITQLRVDGTQRPQIICSSLNCSFEKSHTSSKHWQQSNWTFYNRNLELVYLWCDDSPAIAWFAETLSLQGQFQTCAVIHVCHFPVVNCGRNCRNKQRQTKNSPPWSNDKQPEELLVCLWCITIVREMKGSWQQLCSDVRTEQQRGSAANEQNQRAVCTFGF